MFGSTRNLITSVIARQAVLRPNPAAAAVARTGGAVRFLNVHEYVSMDIMKSHGVKVPECFVATTPEEAKDIFQNQINKRTYINKNKKMIRSKVYDTLEFKIVLIMDIASTAEMFKEKEIFS